MNKHHAGFLLRKSGASHREIAQILKVSENTVTTWSKKYKWEEEITKDFLFEQTAGENVRFLIQHDSQILKAIAIKKTELLGDLDSADIGELEKALTSKGSVDALQKLFTTIKGKELDWEKVVKIIRELTEYVDEHDSKLSKALQPLAHDFLNSKRKQSS